MRLWRARAAVLVTLAAGAVQAQSVDEGRKLFNGGVQPSCAICHKLQDAGAGGEVGPSLDELKPDASRVRKALKNGIGQMPAFPQLTEAQIQALSQYVARAAK
jgi:cytochrome c6